MLLAACAVGSFTVRLTVYSVNAHKGLYTIITGPVCWYQHQTLFSKIKG